MISVGGVLATLPRVLLWWASDSGEQMVEQDAHGTWEAKGSKQEVQPQISFKYMCSDLLPSTRPGCLCVPPYLNSWLETKSLAYRPLGALIKVKNTYYLEIQEIQKYLMIISYQKIKALGFFLTSTILDWHNTCIRIHSYAQTHTCRHTFWMFIMMYGINILNVN